MPYGLPPNRPSPGQSKKPPDRSVTHVAGLNCYPSLRSYRMIMRARSSRESGCEPESSINWHLFLAFVLPPFSELSSLQPVVTHFQPNTGENLQRVRPLEISDRGVLPPTGGAINWKRLTSLRSNRRPQKSARRSVSYIWQLRSASACSWAPMKLRSRIFARRSIHEGLESGPATIATYSHDGHG